MFRITRTLRIDILTLFLALNIISIFSLMAFSYFESHRSIKKFSIDAMTRAGSLANEKLATSRQATTDSLEKMANFLSQVNNLSPDNPVILNVLVDMLNFNRDFSSIFMSNTSGNSVILSRITLTGQHYFMNQPTHPLPEKTAYVTIIINLQHSSNPENWYYKDIQGNTLASESFSKPSINIRIRPWYQGAMNQQEVFWTSFYTLLPNYQYGITAAKRITNEKGQVLGVVGADLSDISFKILTSFLKSPIKGRSGQIFLLDEKGAILIPNPKTLEQGSTDLGLITRGFAEHKKTHQQIVFIKNKQGLVNIIYFAPIAKQFGNDWSFAISAPYESFFVRLIQAQTIDALIAGIVLFISIFVIMAFAKRISSPIVILADEINKVTRLDFTSTKRVDSYIKEIKLIDTAVATMRTALSSFTRYVPKEIVKQLLLQGKEITLEGEKREVTILFSDIQDFTAIAEKNSTETLMALLVEYFDGLSKIILRSKGTIDKYIGDSIMAFWSAPIEIPNHAVLACLAALRCQHFVIRYNATKQAEQKPIFITRFGINTGTVIVGNVGTQERMNYTMIGDAVNIASRLENLDKAYHVIIMISEEVYKQIGHRFLVRSLDQVNVKGKLEKIKIYELVGSLQDEPEIRASADQIELCLAFNKAYECYQAKQFEEAQVLFNEIHQKFPDDYPTQLFLQRISHHPSLE